MEVDMLKPSATKISRQNELTALVAQFQSAGGNITKVEAGVAAGLRRRKYIRKTLTVKGQ
jgi:hypothetical protein